MKEILTFSAAITADASARTISGKIVPFDGEVGNTSAGAVVFEKGSIHIPDTAKVKLLLEHDPKAPIGRAISFTESDNGIDAKFKISNSSRGSDALIEASEDLRTGLSVGVMVQKSKPVDGKLHVTAATLMEVSLVQAAAFATAGITEIAASAIDDAETPQTESEEVVTTAPDTSPAPETEEAPAVEASRPVVTSVAYTKPRSGITTAGQYLEHTIKAAMNPGGESASWISAANDSFTTNPAFSPAAYVRDITSATTGLRPTIDACGGARALGGFGMTVSFPKITTNTTAAIVAEGASTTGTTQMVSSYVTADVKKISSYNVYSLELFERSDPSFYDALLRNVYDAYAVASDAAVIAEIVSGGTQASTQAATSAGMIAYVAQAAPAAYAATKKNPNAFVGGSSVWGLLMGATDSTGRPIYNTNPNGSVMNSAGQAVPTSLRGNVLGLDFYVDPNMVSTTIDDSAFIVTPGSIGILESPQATLQANITSTGEISILYYGYLATKTLISGGLQRFNLT